jgi:hypothetical protein
MLSPRLAPFLVLLPLILLTVSEGHIADTQKQSSKQSKAAPTQELTAGERKAISTSERLPKNTVAIFDKSGTLVKQEKVDPNQWGTLVDYAAKVCTGPVSISPKCVRCENGEIICSSLPAN